MLGHLLPFSLVRIQNVPAPHLTGTTAWYRCFEIVRIERFPLRSLQLARFSFGSIGPLALCHWRNSPSAPMVISPTYKIQELPRLSSAPDVNLGSVEMTMKKMILAAFGSLTLLAAPAQAQDVGSILRSVLGGGLGSGVQQQQQQQYDPAYDDQYANQPEYQQQYSNSYGYQQPYAYPQEYSSYRRPRTYSYRRYASYPRYRPHGGYHHAMHHRASSNSARRHTRAYYR